MSILNGKKIILGISGGIAAYKSINLIRLFVKEGAEVRVVCTQNALEFLTRVTLESVSQNKLYTAVFAPDNDYSTEHVALTDWADIFVVAPATANIIGKYACGIADDALSTSLIAFDKAVFMAPAMNCKMWDNKAVKANCETLKNYGVHFIGPESGFLACGYEGKGRMAEPENIFGHIKTFFSQTLLLKGKKVLVSAGPTHEAIDPVRFIGNHSSGKMGFALAETFAHYGADVTLIAGPVSLKTQHANIKRIDVVSADDMFEAAVSHFPQSDICIMAAAVADYKPAVCHDKKIKKDTHLLKSLALTENKDILDHLGTLKKTHQFLAGFALETDNESVHALKKLQAKNLDLIVLNSMNDLGAGFGTDTNKISLITANDTLSFDLKPKSEVAHDIVKHIIRLTKK